MEALRNQTLVQMNHHASYRIQTRTLKTILIQIATNLKLKTRVLQIKSILILHHKKSRIAIKE